MAVDRRSVLRGLLTAGAGAAAAAAPGVAAAGERRIAPPDAVGMLYDSTKCIGCKACVVACRETNGLEPDTDYWPQHLYQAPVDLNGRTKNVIKLYQEGDKRRFVKAQCMHCVDPACVNACMLGAMKKGEKGIVSYDPGLCIGCRYCQMACPFGVPKFEWAKAAPKIVKCELCRHRLVKGQLPACVEVCPRQAVIYGTRAELLEEAKRRLAEHPERYVAKVYGEHDAGGTQVLYLADVAFEKLGLPDLGTESIPTTQRTLQHGIYKGFVAPIALYAVLGAVMFRNRAHPGGNEPTPTKVAEP
jgi:Fe-S-cluster-containing dehydrogenase component